MGRTLIALIVVVSLWKAGEANAGGEKVITLAENLTVPASSAIELDPLAVNNFNQVALLANPDASGATVRVAFNTEAGKFSDPVPRVTTMICNTQTPAFGGFICFSAAGNTALRIEAGTLPLTITIKAYLTK